jgi:hypothetical protein
MKRENVNIKIQFGKIWQKKTFMKPIQKFVLLISLQQLGIKVLSSLQIM